MSTAAESVLAEMLMRQAFFGESRGVGILRTFQGRYARFFASTALEDDLRVQIADESRHARAYAHMLDARGALPAGLAGIAPGWQTIVRHIATANSFSTTLIGLYGLMEPFNLLAMNTLMPLLDRAERAEVDQIAKDEARHIGMFEVFAELVERGALRVAAAEGAEMIRVFFDALKDGIALPTGERVGLPRSDWREFMKHVGQLQSWVDRIRVRSAADAA